MTDRDYSDYHRGPPNQVLDNLLATKRCVSSWNSVAEPHCFAESRQHRAEIIELEKVAARLAVERAEALAEAARLRIELADLVGQIELFAAAYGEADFEIGKAKALLRACPPTDRKE